MAAAAMHGVEAAGQGMARVRPGFGRDRARDGRRGEAGAGGEADGGGWPEQGRGARGTRDLGRYTHARGEEVPDLGGARGGVEILGGSHGRWSSNSPAASILVGRTISGGGEGRGREGGWRWLAAGVAPESPELGDARALQMKNRKIKMFR